MSSVISGEHLMTCRKDKGSRKCGTGRTAVDGTARPGGYSVQCTASASARVACERATDFHNERGVLYIGPKLRSAG